ncbi:CIA30 family protein [Lysobacter sp. CA199]|uniref:CIA30 family protein n=1 Tax=Lysobacter sp. CA199 TaxID=3455608 RepID=UPI003F8D2EE3
MNHPSPNRRPSSSPPVPPVTSRATLLSVAVLLATLCVAAALAAAVAAPAPAATAAARAPDANLAVVRPGAIALDPGARWSATSDGVVGGKSTARLEPGKSATPSLAAKGEIVAGLGQTWGGLMFDPGSLPMSAADASAVREMRFRVRGDGRSLMVLAFSGAGTGDKPAIQMVQSTAQSQQVSMPLAGRADIDLKRLRTIAVSAIGAPGPFEFEIESFELR